MNIKVLNIVMMPVMVLGLFLVFNQGFTFPDQNDPWEVPEKFVKMQNPVDGQLDLGKDLYNLHCKSCHGKEGLGDGPKAAQLETPSGDFTSDAFAKQTDGSIFYKTLTGRDDMPSFEKKMSHNEIWSVVNYVRTLE